MVFLNINFAIRSIAVLSFLIFILTVFPGCNQEEKPIVIGATMSQSGSYSTQGIPAKNGYKLCQDHINEQGGVLGRDIQFLIYDDESDSDTAISLYEQLITKGDVDLVMGPYGSTLTEAVAPVTEKYQMVHVSPLAATSSIWEQGREYLFMVLPPAELFLAGLIELADENGLSRVAIIREDQLFPKAAGSGAAELAQEKGMEVLIEETYSSGTDDFTDLLNRIKEEQVEVVGMAASALGDFVTVIRQMEEMGVHVEMFGTSGAVDEFRDELGPLADYTYGLTAWEPTLPYPGIGEFTESYQNRYGRSPSFHAAGAYGSCQLFMEAIEKAGSLDSDAIRDELLALETTTIFSEFTVDERGYQTANRGLFIQWQEGEKVVVWPDDLATGEPLYPTPSWSER